MAAGEVYQEILEHLKKDGPFNTFRLARDLNLDRSKLLNFIEKLEKAGAVEVQHGVVKFLKFVAEEKKVEKPIEVKKPVLKPKMKEVKKRKKVKKKLVAPKTHAENKELKEKILQLESKVEELEKKASAPSKIIKKTIVKEVPAPSISAPIPHSPEKKKIKKVKKKPKKKRDKKKVKKTKKKPKKFKFPKFTFMKNIKQLKKPEFAKK